eukprot:1822915-Prymnesium_polylepis.1
MGGAKWGSAREWAAGATRVRAAHRAAAAVCRRSRWLRAAPATRFHERGHGPSAWHGPNRLARCQLRRGARRALP